MEKGLISIIIPCYNTEKFLEDCVKSIDAQTYKNFEAIFVDDGSTDGTLSLLKTLCNGKENYKVFSKENGGVSSARNFGIAHANGEFIQFLDADDMLAPNYLETMINSIGKNDICICKFNFCKENSHSNKCQKVKKEKVYTDNTTILCQFLSSRIFRLGMANKFYRHEIIEKMPNYPNAFNSEISYGEDSFFITNYLMLCNTAKWLDFKGYYYRSRKGSSVHSTFSEKKLSIFKMHEINLKTFENNEEVLTYAKSFYCVSCVEMLFRIYASQYNNAEKITEIYQNMIKYVPALKKAKLCPWYNRKLIPLATPIIKMLLHKRMK